MISISHSCDRMLAKLCAASGQSRKSRAKGTVKGDLLWKRDPASRGHAAPSPDTTVAGSIAFVCAFLGKFCVHTLGVPFGSAASVDDSRGAGAGAKSQQTPLYISGAGPQMSRSPASHSSLRPLRALHPSSVADWSYSTEKTISTC